MVLQSVLATEMERRNQGVKRETEREATGEAQRDYQS
jgi:hypothetical protein